MRTLDLHHVEHRDVELLVENFVLQYATPLRIIVGNSNAMKAYVNGICDKHDLKYDPESDYNLGSWIITET